MCDKYDTYNVTDDECWKLTDDHQMTRLYLIQLCLLASSAKNQHQLDKAACK